MRFLQWCQRWVLYSLLNVYPLLALAVGALFLVKVEQAREIFANLLEPKGQPHPQLWLYVAALVFWGASIWYSMRLLSSTRFPGASRRRWPEDMRAHAPRVCGFAALVIGALASGLFLEKLATLRVLVVLAVGVPPLTWAVMTLGDYAFKTRVRKESGRDYREYYPVAAPAVALVCAGLVAWGSDLVSLTLRLPDEPAEWQLTLSVVAWFAAARVENRLVQATLRLVSLAAWAGVWLFVGPSDSHAVPLVILFFASFGLWWTSRRRGLHGFAHDDAGTTGDPGPWRFGVLALAIAMLALLILGFSLSTHNAIAWGNALGTFAIAFLGFSLWCFFGTVLWVYWPKRFGLASFAIVPACWALLGPSADHALRGTSFVPAERKALREHMTAWLGDLQKQTDLGTSRHAVPRNYQRPVFLVAASGGGLRAAYWTAAVLAAADDATCGEFGRHVYAYSGVSGGSLGIAAYLAQRRVWESSRRTIEERCAGERVGEITRVLDRDFLAPVAGTMLFAEGFQRFTFVKYLQNERGNVLADSWSKAWDDVYGKQAKGLFGEPFVTALGAPAVFLNATGVGSGRRVIQSNVRTDIPGADDFFLPQDKVALQTHGLTVSEAVLNSARFTYVSPAGTVEGCFPTDPAKIPHDCPNGKRGVWDRVVDGGYFENSGLATLSDVLRALRKKEKKTDPSPLPNPVFIIIITNSAEAERACPAGVKYNLVRKASTPGDQQRDETRKEDDADPGVEDAKPPPDAEVTSFAGLMAPIDALLNVRDARAGLEVRRVAATRKCSHILDWSLFPEIAPRQPAPKPEKTAAAAAKDEVEDLQQQPALGWFLSHRSTQWMDKRARAYAKELPFELAACYKPGTVTRGLLGGPEVREVRCPADPAKGH